VVVSLSQLNPFPPSALNLHPRAERVHLKRKLEKATPDRLLLPARSLFPNSDRRRLNVINPAVPQARLQGRFSRLLVRDLNL
jgi:hypothetical protein